MLFALIAAIIASGCFRIVSTYDHFWQTWDEPFHLAAGLEWWEQGSYTYERMHPPLARIMIAMGPYLAGMRAQPDGGNHWAEGSALLHTSGTYDANLRLARLGVLPFFVIGAFVVAMWAWRCCGAWAAVVATLVYSLLPPVLGNAGLATLDMAVAALVPAALLAFVSWLETPSLARSFVLGLVTALAVCTKFTAIAFLGAGFAVAFFLQRPRNMRGLCVGAVVASVVCLLGIWSIYKFSMVPLLAEQNNLGARFDGFFGTTGASRNYLHAILAFVPVPAIEFFWGIYDVFVFRHSEGSLEFFMGDIRKTGWWYFYPVMLVMKSPVPFLLLVGTGLAGAWRERSGDRGLRMLAGIALAVLLAGVMATPNNGLRQILPVYPLLAIVAGCGAIWLHRSLRPRLAAWGVPLVLIAWCAVTSWRAHPDYSVFFNELAGAKPERFSVDSDLDWGQDLKRLAATCQARGIKTLSLSYNGSKDIDLAKFPLPEIRELVPGVPTVGWVAISVRRLVLGSEKPPYDQYGWLKDAEPVEKVGSSIYLYRLYPGGSEQ